MQTSTTVNSPRPALHDRCRRPQGFRPFIRSGALFFSAYGKLLPYPPVYAIINAVVGKEHT